MCRDRNKRGHESRAGQPKREVGEGGGAAVIPCPLPRAYFPSPSRRFIVSEGPKYLAQTCGEKYADGGEFGVL